MYSQFMMYGQKNIKLVVSFQCTLENPAKYFFLRNSQSRPVNA